MVSIVIVSHSLKLAEGVRELALQMGNPQLTIALAAGLDDPQHPIGTDPIRVYEAINSVYTPDGVIVLMDLGSALLSAETALELLPVEKRAHIYLCEAPLVEGAIVVVVQASAGATVPQILAEARGALALKTGHLAAPIPLITLSTEMPAQTGETIQLTIQTKHGLHARPAAQLVLTANRFQAQIELRRGQKRANAKSINQVATLGAQYGDVIQVTAAGADATPALSALKQLAETNFGEKEGDLPPLPIRSETPLSQLPTAKSAKGVPASPGIALAPAWHYRPVTPSFTPYTIQDVPAEWARLQAALQHAQQELSQLQTTLPPPEAQIFLAHQLILQDPTLQTDLQQRLTNQALCAEAIWSQTISQLAQQYAQLDDPYLQARAGDVGDLEQRVLRHLLGVQMPQLTFSEPVILCAVELTPSDTAQLDPTYIQGLCCQHGTTNSHSAILARALGIPAIVGLGPILADVPTTQLIGMDGNSGQLWVDPTETERAQLQQKRANWLTQQRQAKQASQLLAHTADGKRIEISANIGGLHDARLALAYGAEGIGLFRTEFLFFNRQTPPTEEEQLAIYRQVAEQFSPRPLIVRTLDIGGDKPLPYLDLGKEENPFLGWRGIRFCLATPHIFKPQLRAILQASAGNSLRLMFPMISTLGELRAAKVAIAETQAELQAEGLPFNPKMGIGIMIEVPAAVLIADQLAQEVDFFSIGTNDLTQYTMAADRGNPKVAALINPFQPAVLRMIQQTVEAGHRAGIWVGLCGELAGNPQAIPLLIGLGLDELSMNAPAIPTAKALLRQYTLAQTQKIAKTALSLETATTIEKFLKEKI